MSPRTERAVGVWIACAAVACGGTEPAARSASAGAPIDARAEPAAVVDLVPAAVASAAPVDAPGDAASAEGPVEFGMIGLLNASAGGAFGEAGGEVSALGGLTGDGIGDAFGAGGLGLSGIGPGAGGVGEGIGLGSIGTIGHGAGTGTSQGFGTGTSRLGGSARSGAASVRTGDTTVVGRLPPEVIRRIVRQNLGRMRLCYESALTKNPKLAGRVTVKFTIDRGGAVASSSVDSKDLPDDAVALCVARTFKGLSFPAPEGGGAVVVRYPVSFSPGDGSAPAAPSAPKVASVNGSALADASASDVEAALVKAGWQLASSTRRNGPGGASSIVDLVAKKDGVTASVTCQPAKHADASISFEERSRIESAGATRSDGDFYLAVVVVGDVGKAQTLLTALLGL